MRFWTTVRKRLGIRTALFAVASVAGCAWLTLGATGCASGEEPQAESGEGGGDSGEGGGASTTLGTGGSGGDVVGSGGAPLGVPGCADGSDDIFLLGFDLAKSVLYRFDAPTLTLDELGPIVGCPVGTGFFGRNPWGAALDRDATLWTHYLEWDSNLMQFTYDRVYTIDTKTGACADTGMALSDPSDQYKFEYGMAFLPDPSDVDKDILYAAGVADVLFDDAQLNTVDLGSMAPTPVSALVDTRHSYLTGTGDGRLFTFYQGTGVRELDPKTGTTVSEHLIAELPNSSGPFVFWGGALWIFWAKTYTSTALVTDIYRVDLATYEATLVKSVDFLVTAASVSTCAPLEVPK